MAYLCAWLRSGSIAASRSTTSSASSTAPSRSRAIGPHWHPREPLAESASGKSNRNPPLGNRAFLAQGRRFKAVGLGPVPVAPGGPAASGRPARLGGPPAGPGHPSRSAWCQSTASPPLAVAVAPRLRVRVRSLADSAASESPRRAAPRSVTRGPAGRGLAAAAASCVRRRLGAYYLIS
jgi:hypothetical protein